jgi:hypothetical protein
MSGTTSPGTLQERLPAFRDPGDDTEGIATRCARPAASRGINGAFLMNRGRAGVGGRGDSNSRYAMGPKLQGWGVSANETVPLGDHIARFWVRSSRCARGIRNASVRPRWVQRIPRRFLSGAYVKKSELSLYALEKSAAVVSQLCYSPSRGEGRNDRRLALAR